MGSQGLRPEGYFLLKEGATKSCKWGTNAVESNSSHCCTSSGSSQHLHILQFYSLSLLFLPTDGRGSSWLSDGLPRVLQPLLERLLPPLSSFRSSCSQPCHPYLPLIPPLGTQPFEITSLKMSQGMSWPNWIRGKVRCFFSSPLRISLFESNQTRCRQHLNQSATLTTHMIATVEKSPQQWPWKSREDPSRWSGRHPGQTRPNMFLIRLIHSAAVEQ